MTTPTMSQIPFVEYLVLDQGEPHLVAHQCTSCGARFFDRRNACAGCSNTEFTEVVIPTEGEVRAFTIVAFAAPGVVVPFAAAIVDCGGTSVRGNVVNTPIDAEHITLGMRVKLTTTSMGEDSQGVEAVNYAFEPA